MPELLRNAPPFATLTSPAYDALAAEARATMQARQPALDERWRMGTWQNWGYLQAEGVLHFADPDGSGLKAPGQLLGSYDAETDTWEWAWNNPTVVNPAIVADARAVRTYGETHGHAPLTTGVVKASMREAMGMVAVAVTVTGAEGAYWGIVGGRYMFVIAFGDVTPVAPTASDATEPAAPPGRQGPREVADAIADVPLLLRWCIQASRYVLDPLTLMRTGAMPTTNTLAPLTAEDEERLPAALRACIADAERGLAGLGFGAPVRAANAGAANVRSCVTFLEHAADAAIGFVSGWAGPQIGVTVSATFRTDFADGTQLVTSNFQSVLRTPPRPYVLGASFPEVHDVVELYDLHRFRVAERARTVAKVPLTRGPDVLAFQAEEARETFDFWVKKGYYRRVSGDTVQLTRRGATLAAWRGLFPWRHVTEWRHGRGAARVMRRYRGGRRS